jgi:hypothetical protein
MRNLCIYPKMWWNIDIYTEVSLCECDSYVIFYYVQSIRLEKKKSFIHSNVMLSSVDNLFAASLHLPGCFLHFLLTRQKKKNSFAILLDMLF